jgi:hypothetical protein
MKLRQFLSVPMLVLSSWAVSYGIAGADTVIYDSASVVDGEQGFVEPFSITTPGTLTVTISNIPWLDVVTDLTSYLSTTNGVIGTTMYAAGTETMSIGPGTFYAHWFGNAQGTYNEGVLGIDIQFQPSFSTVPLPGSLLLLLSGLGFLYLWPVRRQDF